MVRDHVAQVLEKAGIGGTGVLGLVDQSLELPRQRLQRAGLFGLGAIRAPFGIARVLLGGGGYGQRTGEKDRDEEPVEHGTPPVWLHREGRL